MSVKNRLFSYCIPIDDGAAPNPFWGICTLTICKPVIRRVAKKGDWIAGVGSKNVEGIDYSGKLVYAMKVTDIMSLEKYDEHCNSKLIGKIPDVRSQDYKRRVGDCIYDFGTDPNGRLRLSVHNYKNKETDLGGKNALLSTHFYYFGDHAENIPDALKPIIKQGQGHRSNSNDQYFYRFINWIESEYEVNKIYGNPQYQVRFNNVGQGVDEIVCDTRCNSAIKDERMIHSHKVRI